MPPKRRRIQAKGPPSKRKRLSNTVSTLVSANSTSPLSQPNTNATTVFIFCPSCSSSASPIQNGQFQCDNHTCKVRFIPSSSVNLSHTNETVSGVTSNTGSSPSNPNSDVTSNTGSSPVSGVTSNTGSSPSHSNSDVTSNTGSSPSHPNSGSSPGSPLDIKSIFPTQKERVVALEILKKAPQTSENHLRTLIKAVFDHGTVGGKKNCIECAKTHDGSRCKDHIRRCKCGASFPNRNSFRNHLTAMGYVSKTVQKSARRIDVLASLSVLPGTISMYFTL
jgi:hypothetical protein